MLSQRQNHFFKMGTFSMQIIPIIPALAAKIALLHMSGIQSGFLTSLGQSFLTKLYIAAATSPFCFGYAAIKDHDLLGYVIFSEDLGKLYRCFLKTQWWQLLLVLTPTLNWKKIKGIMENFFYPSRIRKLNLPKACILSSVVAEHARNQKIAERIIMRGLDECRQRGINRVRVLTSHKNDAANALYIKCGFEHFCDTNNHGVPSYFYVVDLQKQQFKTEGLVSL